jgi:hypothetical protein
VASALYWNITASGIATDVPEGLIVVVGQLISTSTGFSFNWALLKANSAVTEPEAEATKGVRVAPLVCVDEPVAIRSTPANSDTVT